MARVVTFAVPYEVDGLAMRLVIRSRRTGRALNRLTAYEVALLEVLGDWERVVDMPSTDAIARLASLVGRSIRVDAVVAAASTESARVRERLRLVLQAAGCTDAVADVAPAAHERTRSNALAGFSTSARRVTLWRKRSDAWATMSGAAPVANIRAGILKRRAERCPSATIRS